ncbi:phage tail tip fiber protein [Salmonella enterica]|uniref:phage tail tip fiber protein n=1 Tax=Salmonella enterica TaxID=28901 RepID=UPI003D18DCFF
MLKIQKTQNGVPYVAGIGAGIENVDGQTLSQILLAANRIAFIDPANGNTTPMLVAQGGQLFMNEALVKYLSATTITAPTITSGGNPPAFSLTPDGRLAARNADISGNINANYGTLSNVHILNNCQVDGAIRANQIEGDIAKTYVINGNSVYISPQMFDMNLVCMMGDFNIILNGAEQSPVLSVEIARWQTGSSWVGGSPGHGGGSYVPSYDRMCIKVYRLNAGTPATISGTYTYHGSRPMPRPPHVIWMSKA